jgi:hypothetical protein
MATHGAKAIDAVTRASRALGEALELVAPYCDVNVCVAEGELLAARHAVDEALGRLIDSLGDDAPGGSAK